MQTIPANQLLAGLTLAEPVAIRAVVTDSRKVEPGCVFVCFPGERVDGHDYAAGAYRSGAEYIVANHPVEGVPAERTVIVPDSGKAMIRMASNYRMLFNPQNDRRHGQRRQDDDEGVLLRGALRLRQDPQDRGQPEQ